MAWMGRGLHTYNFEVRQVEKHTPRRRRPIPCRRFRNRRAKRVDYWRTPPHLTANVRLVSRTYASCHVRNGVVTFPPRDGERKYESRHVVSLRTPPRGGCTTEPSTCVAWRSLVWRAIDIRFYRIGNPASIKNCPHSFRQNGSDLESQSVQITPLNLPIRQLLSIEGVIECIECIECTQ